jgi:hypothetical protein
MEDKLYFLAVLIEIFRDLSIAILFTLISVLVFKRQFRHNRF